MPFRPSVASLLALLAPTVAGAQDFVSADISAMGGAAVADPRDNSVVTTSPANIGLTDQFDIQLGFVGGFDREWIWSASAIDGRTNEYIKFGLDYSGSIRFPPFHPDELPGWAPIDTGLVNRQDDHHVTLALAAPVLDRRLSFGLNGTLSILQREWAGQTITGNMDIGVAAQPIPQFSVGFVAKSFLPIEDQVRTPGSVALGLRGGLPDALAATAEVEYRYEDVVRKPWVVRTGLEGIIRDVGILRAGWNWDGDRANHHLTLGFGLQAKGAGRLSYSIMIPVIPHLRGIEIGHGVTLTLFTSVASNEEQAPIRWDDRR